MSLDSFKKLFTTPSWQLARARKLSQDDSWGFSEAEFAAAEKSVPVRWPEKCLVAVTLVPYFNDRAGVSGVLRTFRTLWKVAARQQPNNCLLNKGLSGDVDSLALTAVWLSERSKPHRPGLCWEVIDLGNLRRAIELRSDDEYWPSAGVLAAAVFHPKWVGSMNGGMIPYVWVPGYELNIVGKGARMPVGVAYKTGVISLCYDHGSLDNTPRWATARFVPME